MQTDRTNNALLTRYGHRLAVAVRALDELIGVPFDAEAGVDCMTTAADAYRLIGEALDDAQAWSFPTIARPYTLDAIGAFAGSWLPIAEPRFGAVVDFGHDHVGIVAELGPAPRVLHNSETIGSTVRHHWRAVRPYITGLYVLDRNAAGGRCQEAAKDGTAAGDPSE